jgi:molybdopterin-guanine dinucleotide biosynthesis protein A
VSGPPSHPPAIVAVLAGGAGSRLGQSKPLAPLGGASLVEYPLAATREAGLPVVVVAKESTRLPELAAGLVLEPEEPLHPLLGAIAALRFAAGADVVTVPCDMPFVPGGLLAFLASLEGAATLAGQPLLSRLPAAARPSLERSLAAGDAAHAAIAALGATVLGERYLARFGEPARICFNVNTPEDLRRAEQWLAPSGGAA